MKSLIILSLLALFACIALVSVSAQDSECTSGCAASYQSEVDQCGGDPTCVAQANQDFSACIDACPPVDPPPFLKELNKVRLTHKKSPAKKQHHSAAKKHHASKKHAPKQHKPKLSSSEHIHKHHKTGDEMREEIVHKVNSMKTSWKAKKNTRFSGQPIDAIKRQLGTTFGDRNSLPTIKPTKVALSSIPEEFDSRSKWPNCPSIKEIRDQSDCGSCWAFGAVESATDRICIGTNGTDLTHLSAADLLSCCTNVEGFYNCNGCNGGSLPAAWNYLTSVGVVTGGNYNDFSYCVSYPFETCEHHNNHTTYPQCSGLNGGSEYTTPTCANTCDSESSYKIPYASDAHVFASAYNIPNDTATIQQEIMTNGPVEAAFLVYADFETYSSGVYQHVTGAYLGGHAVRIIGWGVDEESSLPYWLIANSWNQDWGLNGLFKMLRGVDECGIEDGIVTGLYQ